MAKSVRKLGVKTPATTTPEPGPPVLTGNSNLDDLLGILPIKNSSPAQEAFFPAGTKFTQFEIDQMKEIGITDLTKVPMDLAKRIQAAKTAMDQEAAAKRPTTPIDLPPLVDVNDLPPERREQIMQSINNYQSTIGSAPSPINVSEAPPANPPPDPQPRPALEPLPEPPPAAPASIQTNVEECPCCRYNLSVPWATEPTEKDIEIFTQAILGGKRFVKEYKLLDGKITARFRSWTPHEADQAAQQMIRDAYQMDQTRMTGTSADYLRTLMGYRMTLSVARIELENDIIEIPEFDQYELDEKQIQTAGTRLRAYHDSVTKEAFASEALRTIIGRAYHHFQGVYDGLVSRGFQSGFSAVAG